MTAKLAVVEWQDAAFYQNFHGEIDPDETYLVESVSIGYLFKLKNEIGLIQNKQGEDMDILFIPKKWVKKITFLEVRNEKRKKTGKKARHLP
jgi:hypothetical protein